jgi:hypothetical protein
MSKVRILFLGTLISLATLPTLGQLAPSSCTDIREREVVLNTFIAASKGGPGQQKQARDIAKTYLRVYGNCGDAATQANVQFLRKWIADYEHTGDQDALVQAIESNPAQAFSVAQPLLAAKPDDLHVQLLLLVAGIKCVQAGDRSHDADALAAAKHALELVNAGKTVEHWAPFTSAQDAPDGLRYYIAFFSAEKSPDDAIANLTQVAKSKSSFSRDATTYQLLGAAYYKGEVARMASEYKSKYTGKEDTPEAKALLEKINGTLDKVIGCYARAVALSDGNSAQASVNAASRKVLSTIYAQRHDGSTDGMDQVVSKALSEPLP